MTATASLRLREHGPAVEHRLSVEQAEAVRQTGLVSVEYLGSGRYRLCAGKHVGMARTVHGVEVVVEPKLAIARLIYLLGYSRRVVWRPELLAVPLDEDLLPAVARVLATLAEQALSLGVLQGYRTVEEAVPTVRGRLLVGQQLRRRAGLVVPVECRFDDWGVDIPENRLLLAGTLLARALPGVPHDVRRRLHRIERMLAGVPHLPPRSAPPQWQPSRLNVRYQPALRMSEIILRHTSAAALAEGPLPFHGFVVPMDEVFESFLSETLGPALGRHGGEVEPQARRWLDADRQVGIRPDLLWKHGAAVRAVIDAKYKAVEKVYNTDVYQLVTYCIRLGLPIGHLVYAAGQEPVRRYLIPGADVTIMQHALDLSAPTTAALHGDVDALAERICGSVAAW